MWDAYATTGRFPYSQPRADGTNYIRNSVKVVINAYDGKITLYQIDPDDALTNTWGKVYKGLFTPGDQMPADLRAHMRYPEDLYSMQAEVLSTYHVQDSDDVLQQRGRLADPHGAVRMRKRSRWCPTTSC